MDGTRWNEVYQTFKLPANTLLLVWAIDKNGRDVTDLFFDNFIRALSHYASMTERREVVEVYLTVYLLRSKGLKPLSLLNRSGYASEGITISSWHRPKETE
jgi:hypothetical protein